MDSVAVGHPPPIATPQVGARLLEFRQAVIQSGLMEYSTTFNPYLFSHDKWVTHRNYAAPQLRPIIDFFLLGGRVREELLSSRLGETWQILVDLELAHEADGWLQMNGLMLHAFTGHLLFIDLPSPDPNVYFGDDSIGLFTRLVTSPNDVCLDLCSGSGVQALQCANQAKRVDAVEINNIARRILACNVLLNGREDKVHVFGGSLYDHLEEGEYDLITSNPPLVPFPEHLPYPFVGHGGLDGLSVTRRIIEGLPVRLTSRGRAQIIALTFSDGAQIMVHNELVELAKRYELDINITLLNHFELTENSVWLNGLAASSAFVTNMSAMEVKRLFKDRLDKASMSHLSPYFLFITHGKGRLTYQNFSRVRHGGLWNI